MARLFTEDFEGISNGTTLTTSNTAFDAIVGSPTASTAHPAEGTVGALCSVTTSAARSFQVSSTTLGTRSVLYACMYVYLTAAPGAVMYVMSVNSGGAARATVRINTDRTISIRNNVTAVYTSASALALDTLYRLEWRVDNTASVQEIRAYAGHSTSTYIASGTQTYNTGTLDTFICGIPIATTNSSVYVDWVALDGSTWVGPAVVSNVSPTCSAGADARVNPGATVNRTGTDSDSDGTISTRAWTQVSGPAVSLSGASTASVSFTAPSSGTVVLRYTVTDNGGASTSDDVSFVVNTLPVANAGSDQTGKEPGDTITLSGSSSDSDGTVVTRAWTQTSGTSVSLSGASTATATFTAPATIAGETLVFTYTVTDDDGGTDDDTVSITVLPATERYLSAGGTWTAMYIRSL